MRDLDAAVIQSVSSDVKFVCCVIRGVAKSTEVSGSSIFGYLFAIISPRMFSGIYKKDSRSIMEKYGDRLIFSA